MDSVTYPRLKPALPIVLVLSAVVLVIVIESHALTEVPLRRPCRTDYDYAHEHDELGPTWNSHETVELLGPPRLNRGISGCIRSWCRLSSLYIQDSARPSILVL